MVAFFGLNPTSSSDDDALTQKVVSASDDGVKTLTKADESFVVPEDSLPSDNVSGPAPVKEAKVSETSSSPFDHTGGWDDGGFGDDTDTFSAKKDSSPATSVSAPADAQNPFGRSDDKNDEEKPEPEVTPEVEEEKPLREPEIADEKPSFSPTTSGDSLEDIESKLKTKKDDLNSQIEKIQDDLKKIEDALAKISDLRSKESEMVAEVKDLV